MKYVIVIVLYYFGTLKNGLNKLKSKANIIHPTAAGSTRFSSRYVDCRLKENAINHFLRKPFLRFMCVYVLFHFQFPSNARLR